MPYHYYLIIPNITNPKEEFEDHPNFQDFVSTAKVLTYNLITPYNTTTTTTKVVYSLIYPTLSHKTTSVKKKMYNSLNIYTLL